MRTKFDSTIAKALASTVLVSSCSPDASFLQPLSEHEDSTSKKLNDSKGVSISLNINDKMREDLNNLEPLVNEILNDSTAAKRICCQPKLILHPTWVCNDLGLQRFNHESISVIGES